MVNDIISVNGISKSFGPISALCDVSLSVQQGLVTAIVGDNGSGKSTLIKLLSGSLAPDAGTITVEGREHTHLTIAQALQMGIRTVYQDLSLDDWKNSYENIFLGHERMHGPFLDRCRMEREAAELLKRLEITIPDLTQPVRVLSGGQRQGIAIARAMLQPGRLLLLDEPTAAMGIRESHQTMQLLRRLRQDPPFADQFTVTVTGPEETPVRRAIELLRQGIGNTAEKPPYDTLGIQVIGPAPAPVVKVNGVYRYRLLVLGKNTAPVRELLAGFMRAFVQRPENRRLHIYTDCDKMD